MVDVDVVAKAAHKAVYRWQRPDLPEERWEEAWHDLPDEPDGMSAVGLPKAKETFRVLARAVLEAAGGQQKVGLDKALEACRLMEAACRLERKAREYTKVGDVEMMVRCVRRYFAVADRAAEAAREALNVGVGGPNG